MDHHHHQLRRQQHHIYENIIVSSATQQIDSQQRGDDNDRSSLLTIYSQSSSSPSSSAEDEEIENERRNQQQPQHNVHHQHDQEERVISVLRSIANNYKSRIPQCEEATLLTITHSGSSSNNSTTANNALVKLNERRITLYTIMFLVFSINVFTFVGLCIVRPMSSFERTVAKNSALMTLFNMLAVFLTIGMAGDTTYDGGRHHGRVVHQLFAYMLVTFSLVHTVAHLLLLYRFSEFDLELMIEYLTLFVTIKYVSGIFMLVSLCVTIACSTRSVRSKRYNLFYAVHLINIIILLVTSAAAHSWLLATLLALLCLRVYGTRLVTRYISRRTCVVCRQLSSSFALIDLRVPITWLSKLFFLNTLNYEQGNATIWISSSTVPCKLGRIERHPFSVIETYSDNRCAYIRLMISRSGDWKHELHKRLVSNANLDLYSNGVSVVLDTVRSAELRGRDIAKSTYTIFVLENVGISVFLGFLRTISDPRNRKVLHKHVRFVRLYYYTTDHNYLACLNTYLDMCEQLKKFLDIKWTVFSPKRGVFRGSRIEVVANSEEGVDLKRMLSELTNEVKSLDEQRLATGEHRNNIFLYVNSPDTRERLIRECKRANNRCKRLYRKQKDSIQCITINI